MRVEEALAVTRRVGRRVRDDHGGGWGMWGLSVSEASGGVFLKRGGRIRKGLRSQGCLYIRPTIQFDFHTGTSGAVTRSDAQFVFATI